MRTIYGISAHYNAFIHGTSSVLLVACTMATLVLIPRNCVVMCMLH